METLSPTEPAPSGIRSTFLTVICILTFIGSGWGVLSSVRHYAAADTIAEVTGGAMRDAQDQMNQQDMPDFANQLMNSIIEGMSAENIRKLAIVSFISNLLTLTGAIMMWNLKKTGFYLYIAGIAVLMFSPLAIGKLIGLIGLGFSGFIGVIFIIMYGVNLKYMDK